MFVAAAAFAPSPAQAEAWENVTVITIAEGEYLNVTIESVEGDSTSIIVSHRGSPRILSFEKIRVIIDERGNNITSLVFPWLTATDEVPAIPESGAVNAERPRRAPFAFMFSADAGYGAPAGDWFDGMTAGFLGAGSMRLAVSENSFFGFSYRRQQLGIEDQYELLCIEDYALGYYCVPVEWTIHLDELYFSVGYMSRVSTPRSPFAYVEIGLGAIRHAIETEVENFSAESSEWEAATLICSGGVLSLGSKIGLHAEADMRVTGKDFFPLLFLGDQSGPTGLLFAFKIGIVVLFGPDR